ncbi:alpha/beta hydrolase [Flagellimonas sp. 389]|uniref:alpha/beta fold hydrolase n=1 Tax=Flagellimonas sp. 389 TaxID=2835862 RepID=UPI001BD676D2|nr:alpha/beta hydrolase [Flagellimonas sp. 389]MBS9463507.1 alpha/beta hydrolase [Flagellimonas sp. 389]
MKRTGILLFIIGLAAFTCRLDPLNAQETVFDFDRNDIVPNKNVSLPLLERYLQSFDKNGLDKEETIFDRNSVIYKNDLPVPVVKRYEEILGITGRFELVGNVNLWVEEMGEGIPLVLVSGGPGTSSHYFHPHFLEASKFSRVIYYDLRGVGLSERTPEKEGYSIMQAVDDLENLRIKLGIQKWVVLGLSFGGTITQLYSLKYSESLLGMVLVSSSLPMSIDIGLGSRQYDYQSQKERNRIEQIYSLNGKRAFPVHSEMVNPDLQKKMLFNAFMNGEWKRRHLKKWTVMDMAMYAKYEFVHDKNYYSTMLKDYFNYDLKEAFKNCPIPTLIIDGEWDLAYSSEKHEIMKAQFPNARYLLVKGAGHIPYEENPSVFFETLKGFLKLSNSYENITITTWKKDINLDAYRKRNLAQDPNFQNTKRGQ